MHKELKLAWKFTMWNKNADNRQNSMIGLLTVQLLHVKILTKSGES